MIKNPPGLGRCPEEGNGNPVQYSCLENFMDRGTWWSTGSQRVGHGWATNTVTFTWQILILKGRERDWGTKWKHIRQRNSKKNYEQKWCLILIGGGGINLPKYENFPDFVQNFLSLNYAFFQYSVLIGLSWWLMTEQLSLLHYSIIIRMPLTQSRRKSKHALGDKYYDYER